MGNVHTEEAVPLGFKEGVRGIGEVEEHVNDVTQLLAIGGDNLTTLDIFQLARHLRGRPACPNVFHLALLAAYGLPGVSLDAAPTLVVFGPLPL
jgi:hypothetical protein